MICVSNYWQLIEIRKYSQNVVVDLATDTCEILVDTDLSGSSTLHMRASVTTKNDLDIEFYVTPAKGNADKIDLKRLKELPSTIPEFESLEDVPLAQLSTTKTKKTIIKDIKKEKC